MFGLWYSELENRIFAHLLFIKEKAHDQLSEFRKAISRKVARSFSKYLYDNLKFDSKEELSFYIYHTESLNEKVEREPIIIPYEVDGESHDYYPDFRINDQLYEIKGTWGVN